MTSETRYPSQSMKAISYPSPPWRRRMAGKIAEYALKELRGDDMREQRMKIARHELI